MTNIKQQYLSVAMTPPIDPMTKIEIELLHFLACGLSPQEIAFKLNKADRTVLQQLEVARNKLKATNNEQMVVKALNLGLIDL